MNHLRGFQRDILFVVADLDGPLGLAIKERLQAYYDDDVNHGRLYPNLNELADQGYLRIGKQDDRTNEYSLTDQAREAIDRRMEWQRHCLEPA
jgi:DNA-binding PadR family transcriptional regulator